MDQASFIDAEVVLIGRYQVFWSPEEAAGARRTGMVSKYFIIFNVVPNLVEKNSENL